MIRRWATNFTEGWNRFFFAPTSPATIGLFRVGFGVVIFLALLGRYPFRELFYGEHAIVSRTTMDLYFRGPDLLYFRWLPQGDPWLAYYFLGLIVVTVSLTVGFCTRVSSVLVFLGLISLSNRNFFIDNAGDDLMRINCFFLMFAPSGQAFSVDRWLKLKRGKGTPGIFPSISPWAQRLLQLQLAYLYINTFYLKLPGESWQDGTALYYALRYLELKRLDLKYVFYFLWQIKFATYSVLVGEFSLATFVWLRRFRYWILAVGVLLHLGINLAMQFPIFQYVMIASLVNFIFPEDLDRFRFACGSKWPRWLE